MKVLVVADGHYYIDEEQEVYVESVFDYSFFARYLSVFDDVYAIVRAERVINAPKGCKKASGPHVHFLPIPPSKGVRQFALNYFRNKSLIKKYIKDFECAIFRVPGVVSNASMSLFAKTGKPYALEVVVDPWEYFSKGTINSIFRPVIRVVWTLSLKKACMLANGVSYVTSDYLQKRYPCQAHFSNNNCFTSHYSSVDLPDDVFLKPTKYVKKEKTILVHVANSFSSYGKGHLVLMQAVQTVLQEGYNIEVWFIGDGPLRNTFESFAHKLNISNNVLFLGRLPSGKEVLKKVSEADLFVFPTRAEGLPRVVLEAMSQGLPVISSPVCGIPEVLPENCLVPFDNYVGYAKLIERLIDNPDIMTELSERNIRTALMFRKSLLDEKRRLFYSQLRALLEGANDS